jgi:type II secretory pathway component GspD/PulD (secretin)
LSESNALDNPSKKSLGDQTPCSLNVVNEDPAKILQVLSAQSKTNLVLLSGSEKKLTLNLKDVKLIDMIRHICALTGLRFLKVGGTYVLATEEGLKSAYPAEWEAAHPTPVLPPPAAQPAVVTSLVMLNHISSAKIAPVLEKVFDKQVLTVVAGPTSESPSVMNQDTTKATGGGTTVLNGDPELSTLTARTLILRGPEHLVREAEKLARQLDILRTQVVIEVTIWDINDTAMRELGMSWGFGSINISENDPKIDQFGSFSRTGLNFTSAIKALEKKDQAKILASPNISVLDGERAFILIGDRIIYPVLIGYSQANTPIFSKEEERVGIYLQVAASVASDGEITLSLYPQVSTVTGFLEVNGASYPQISTREAQSTLRIRSGETLVMGGLLKTEEVRQLEKVPLLGDIPFLGELFKRRKTTTQSSQVLISIKPTLLKGDESR